MVENVTIIFQFSKQVQHWRGLIWYFPNMFFVDKSDQFKKSAIHIQSEVKTFRSNDVVISGISPQSSLLGY